PPRMKPRGGLAVTFTPGAVTSAIFLRAAAATSARLGLGTGSVIRRREFILLSLPSRAWRSTRIQKSSLAGRAIHRGRRPGGMVRAGVCGRRGEGDSGDQPWGIAATRLHGQNRCRADLVAAAGQLSRPPEGSYLTVSGQHLVAAVKAAGTVVDRCLWPHRRTLTRPFIWFLPSWLHNATLSRRVNPRPKFRALHGLILV